MTLSQAWTTTMPLRREEADMTTDYHHALARALLAEIEKEGSGILAWRIEGGSLMIEDDFRDSEMADLLAAAMPKVRTPHALETLARAIDPSGFDKGPEVEAWAAGRRQSAFARAKAYLDTLAAAGCGVDHA